MNGVLFLLMRARYSHEWCVVLVDESAVLGAGLAGEDVEVEAGDEGVGGGGKQLQLSQQHLLPLLQRAQQRVHQRRTHRQLYNTSSRIN